jgi:uncharacterized membrane protein
VNGAELHLLLNHFPVIVPMVGLPTVVIGLLAKSSAVQKAGLWILVVGALVSAPAYLTGEPAEVVVKNYPGISRLVIHTHERAAKLSLILMLTTAGMGLLSLLALRAKKRLPPAVWGIFLVLCATSLVFMANTAHLGGLIRHEELNGP